MLGKLKNLFTSKDERKKLASDAVEKRLTEKVANIASNSTLQKIAQEHNLNICRITWEDTGRYKDSCWGPNISDMSLRLGKGNILLPVIRRPNFSDETADLPISNFTLSVGNETAGAPLRQIPLREYLENKDGHIKDASGTPVKSLFCAERDEVILTSAQYCILPLGDGTCEFNVYLYNYQSSSTDPAVLVIVASAKGSSTQVIYGGTTALYFNSAGRAANYIAERLKDERKRLGKAVEGKMDQDEQERNALLIYQIPLKLKNIQGFYSGCYSEEGEGCDVFDECSEGLERCAEENTCRGMDNAVLSVGTSHSDFQEITSADIERDPQFPIRCTIQFYKVTDEEDVPVEAFKEMAENIDRIYKSTDQSGSLVIGNSNRKTEWVNNQNIA